MSAENTELDDVIDETVEAVEAVDADAPESEAAEAPVQEATDLGGQLMRLRADFDNFRKRTIRERGEVAQRANENIIYEMLTVIDHMELAIQSASGVDAAEAYVKGFEMVSGQLVSTLEKFGLSRVAVKDVEFDPNLHEAISQVASEDVAEGGIIECTRSGYLLGEKLLRAAQVVVSSGSGE